jgi:hypothetical protein
MVLVLSLFASVALTEVHQREIGCIALLGLLAEDQRRSAIDADFPDVTIKGRIYAGIVGPRIVAQSGLPQEVIGQAIIAVAEAARAQSNASLEGKAELRSRVDNCLPLMEAELLANAPLPKPQKSKPVRSQ